jgi:hypothetical protein
MSHPLQECPSQLPHAGDVDASGRLLPLTEARRRSRSEQLRAALDEIAAIGPDDTDTEEVWDEVFRGIDSFRPDRPLFGERD